MVSDHAEFCLLTKDLQLGDDVRNADGETGEVEEITTEETTQEMYNLTVDEAHTFYVGDGQWLVHNTGLCKVYRVEGSINKKVIITPKNGNVRIIDDGNMLFLNFGDSIRADEFYLQRISQGMQDVQIKRFLVQDELLDLARNSAVDQQFGRMAPGMPQLVDTTKAANQFGFPPAWIDIIQELIIPGSGRIIK